MPVRKLKEFLDRERVKYVSIVHSTAYTAQEVAASAHITGKELAKTVIVELDGKMAMAVLPANRKIVLQDLREVTGSGEVKCPHNSFSGEVSQKASRGYHFAWPSMKMAFAPPEWRGAMLGFGGVPMLLSFA